MNQNSTTMSKATISADIALDSAESLPIKKSKGQKQADPMETGIVLIAAGDPIYGQLAANVLITLKSQSPEIPVALITSGRALVRLSQDIIRRFDHIIKVDDLNLTDDINLKGQRFQNYFMLKLNIYNLSPFKKTLFLDVDMAWGMKAPVSELLEIHKDSTFQMICEGYTDLVGEDTSGKKYTHWASREDIAAAYGDIPGFLNSKLPKLRSECIYFTKSKENAKFFKTALRVAREKKVVAKRLSGGITDEMCFNIAAAICKHYPQDEKFCPVYWHYSHGLPISGKRSVFLRDFYAVSIGGVFIPGPVRDMYNGLVKHHAALLGIPAPWVSTEQNDKKEVLPQRIAL